jgi:hypothetical protein
VLKHDNGTTETCTLDQGTTSTYTCTTKPTIAPSSTRSAPGLLASGRPGPSRRQDIPAMMSVAYAIVSERKRL